MTDGLSGRRIVVPESRELDPFVSILDRVLQEAGWRVLIAPDDSFHLKPMIASMASLFGTETRG